MSTGDSCRDPAWLTPTAARCVLLPRLAVLGRFGSIVAAAQPASAYSKGASAVVFLQAEVIKTPR
jgi:hypothetical protein